MSPEGSLAAVAALSLLILGCASAAGRDRSVFYQRALAATTAERVGRPAPDEAGAAEARFVDLFADFTPEAVASKVRDVYAADVFFDDAIREIEGVEELERYLVRSAGAASTAIAFDETIHSGGDAFFRWTMEIVLKSGRRVRSPGISHVRFDGDGRVAMQRDFWDSADLLEQLPVVGSILAWVERRF